MTLGELAQFYNGEYGLNCDLTVIPVLNKVDLKRSSYYGKYYGNYYGKSGRVMPHKIGNSGRDEMPDADEIRKASKAIARDIGVEDDEQNG